MNFKFMRKRYVETLKTAGPFKRRPIAIVLGHVIK